MSPSTRARKRARIRRPDEFQRCYREGKMHKNELAVIHVYRRGDDGEARVGFSVSRKLGGAVQRNKVKRWMRESVYPIQSLLPPGIDVVFSARTVAREAGFKRLNEAIRELLFRSRLLSKEAEER